MSRRLAWALAFVLAGSSCEVGASVRPARVSPTVHQDSARERYTSIVSRMRSQDAAEVQAAWGALAELIDELAESATSADQEAVEVLYTGALALPRKSDQEGRSQHWFDLAESAATRFADADRRRYAGTYSRIVRTEWLLARNDFAGARAHAKDALDSDPDPKLEVYAWLALAEIERRRGAATEALRALADLEPRIEDAKDVDRRMVRGKLSLLRSQVFLDLGLTDQAWTELGDAQEFVNKPFQETLYATALVLEFNILLATNRMEEAEARLRPLLMDGKLLREDRALAQRLTLRRGMALTGLEARDPKRAPQAVGLLESVIADPAVQADEKRLAELGLADYYVFQNDVPQVQGHVEEAHRRLEAMAKGSPPDAFVRERAEIEAYRMRAMRTGGGKIEELRAQRDLLDAAYERFLAQLRASENRPGGLGFLHFSTRRFIVCELVEACLAVEPEEKAFDVALEVIVRAQKLGSLAEALDVQKRTVSEIRAELERPGHGLLVFVPDHHRTLVFASSAGEEAICVAAASKEAWKPVLREWQATLAASPAGLDAAALARQKTSFDANGAELVRLLFPPEIQTRLKRWKSVTIVGGDLMDELPFECLRVAGQDLGTEKAIDYLPSLPVASGLLERMRREPGPKRAKAGLWLIAAPAIAKAARKDESPLPPIPFTEANRNALFRPYPKEKSRCFSGKAASRKSLSDPALKDALVLQLVVHGKHLPREVHPSGLLLAPESEKDDGLLRFDQVVGSRVPGIVVVSSCKAGRGQTRYGEDGFNNLGGAFLQAGARCVLISSYDLEAQATQALMEVFHQRLCAGDSPAESMRAARKELCANPRYSHPFYHSLVRVVGLGQLPLE